MVIAVWDLSQITEPSSLTAITTISLSLVVVSSHWHWGQPSNSQSEQLLPLLHLRWDQVLFNYTPHHLRAKWVAGGLEGLDGTEVDF